MIGSGKNYAYSSIPAMLLVIGAGMMLVGFNIDEGTRWVMRGAVACGAAVGIGLLFWWIDRNWG